MILKPGVELLGLRPETLIGVLAAYHAYTQAGYELILTSVTDGTHSRGSRHYVGCAFDCRRRHVPDDVIHVIHGNIAEALGNQFDVVLESTHIHIEYDPEGVPRGT